MVGSRSQKWHLVKKCSFFPITFTLIDPRMSSSLGKKHLPLNIILLSCAITFVCLLWNKSLWSYVALMHIQEKIIYCSAQFLAQILTAP